MHLSTGTTIGAPDVEVIVDSTLDVAGRVRGDFDQVSIGVDELALETSDVTRGAIRWPVGTDKLVAAGTIDGVPSIGRFDL